MKYTMSKLELVKELRSRTQASMKDCSDALDEASLDLEKAIDIIKIKGQNIVVNNNSQTTEGIVKVFNAKDNVSDDILNKQKEIFTEQVKTLNKPEASWSKIVDGKMQKWFSQSCLIDQESIFDSKKKVSDFVGDNKIIDFVRFEVGEFSKDSAQRISNMWIMTRDLL